MKPSESQFPDVNKVDVPEDFGRVTPETQEEIAQHYSKKQYKDK